MRNRISCSAQELSQLDADMIQSVVGGTVFEEGHQYFSTQRVKILDADQTQITAEVHGVYGVYTQTIKLRAGTLSTKCSCPSTEQPFCRHCVAVLLHQFHNGSSLKSGAKENHKEPAPPSDLRGRAEAPRAEESGGAGDLNFWEAILFIDWVQKAVGLLGKEATLPPVPGSLGGVAREWVGVVEHLNSQCLEGEEDRLDALRSLQAAEDMVDTLTKKLHVLKEEAEAAQKNCRVLEKKVKQLQDSLAELSKTSN
ncbi:SWIM zinc finger family protein [Candidatus Nitrospira neomarina]|uniref:SWIM zinc finger family protein n=1 Tax=Candidatus Nitrospira neomarina TaxID=3020899 RepID=A0AA96GN66_9BACT|nr:SWIM zinc finger family protein [Candidatus Nitrospira neomarina]WNM60581.1 SWIM zinc finger family protein [Candidatus Nitrospira neomarina]